MPCAAYTWHIEQQDTSLATRPVSMQRSAEVSCAAAAVAFMHHPHLPYLISVRFVQCAAVRIHAYVEIVARGTYASTLEYAAKIWMVPKETVA